MACNEDMTASDLVGRFLLDANGTRWQDGPLDLGRARTARSAISTKWSRRGRTPPW
ncbi:MAG: AAA family ATPase [Rhodopseudomonas palustris]|nr:AAA family ATPase [Rhodopseudomonas palustris]